MLNNLEKLPYFSLSQFALFYKDRKSALIVISNKLKQKKLYKIREWFYISAQKFLEYSIGNKITSFKEFIATNVVYIPSYLSLEYVLFENNILTENVYTFTLITTKKTKHFTNNFGDFNYKSIKKDFFGDYEILKIDDFLIYKATPEKALFDYLYFKRWVVFSKWYMQELRLNLENINFKKLENLVYKYKSKKVEKIFSLLKKIEEW